MAEKSRRRLMLEQSLAEDPADSFLRYGLAIQCLREGDIEEGRERLRALIAIIPRIRWRPISSLASLMLRPAKKRLPRPCCERASTKARAAGIEHAAAEMQRLLESLELNRRHGLLRVLTPAPSMTITRQLSKSSCAGSRLTTGKRQALRVGRRAAPGVSTFTFPNRILFGAGAEGCLPGR